MHAFITHKGQLETQWVSAFGQEALIITQWPSLIPDETIMIWFMDNTPNLMESIRYMRQQQNIPVVILSMTPSAEASIPFFEAGAAGYCHALSTPNMLKDVAHSILAGGIWIGQSLMQQMLRTLQPAQVQPEQTLETISLLDSLTPQEKKVAILVSQGMTNKEAGRALAITDRTVKAHLSAIFAKLHVRDRIHLSLLIQYHKE